MRTRNVVCKVLLGSLPLLACISVIAQDSVSAPPPPPPVFPATPELAEAPGAQAPRFPSHLTVRPGTWLPIRMEQQLSSDRNQSGESFYATLADPLVVSGVVIAHRGQTVIGRITSAQKAGRVEGVSRLGLEIIGITTADGENVNVHTRILEHNGQSSVGRDLAAVGQATAMGAAIGGMAEGGKGAGVGAGIGAAAGLAGILMTRGKATVVYPETLLTFELETPIEVDTARSGAFRYADSRDYERDRNYSTRQLRNQQPPPPPPYYGGYGPGWGMGYPGGFGGIGIIIGGNRGWGNRGWGGRGWGGRNGRWRR